MDITKDLEGKAIFAIPTGNNARHWDEKPIRFEVIKVKRKYVELRRDGSHLTNNYCKESGATQCSINSGYGLNAGYMFFESLEEIDNYQDIHQKKIEISDYFIGYRVSLSDDQTRAIHKIIFESEV